MARVCVLVNEIGGLNVVEKATDNASFEQLGVRMIRPGVWVVDGTHRVWLGHPRDLKLLEYGDPDLLARIVRDEVDENQMPADFPRGWTVTFPRADGKLGVSFRGTAADAVAKHLATGVIADVFLRPPPERTPSPNEACPCGSGKKFKRCCGGLG